jgi:hypothetical protein
VYCWIAKTPWCFWPWWLGVLGVCVLAWYDEVMPLLLPRTHGFSPRVSNAPHLLNGVCTYAIWDGVYVKIGKSTGSPIVRMAGLQTGNARPLHLLAYTTQWPERYIQRKHWRDRVKGEWYAVSRRLLGEVVLWDWLDERLYRSLRNRS